MREEEMEAAGLLGTPGELDAAARAARVELIELLVADGAEESELRAAVEQHRLVLLPLERALQVEGERVSPRVAAERTGLSLAQLDQLRETLGLSSIPPDAEVLSPLDLEAFAQAGAATAAGVPFEGVLEINAVLAASMPGLAAAMRHMAATVMVTSSDERRSALELAAAGRDLLPMVMPVLEYAVRAHVEQQVVSDYVEAGIDRDTGSPHSVGFADLVGFTRLSEVQQPEAVGALSDRLAQVTRSVVVGRTRLVKTIGDAVMLTAPTAAELVSVLLDLLDAVRASDDLPPVHCGVAHGPVLHRAGDVFGRPVNRASRVTDRAPAGGLVCDEAAYDGLRDRADLVLDPLDPVELKGVEGAQRLWSIRRAGPAEAEA